MDKKLVGERIKKIRQKLGESQEEFGKHFDPAVSKVAVSRWENGTTKPEAKRLQIIADRGGVTVDYLIHGGPAERLIRALKQAGFQEQPKYEQLDLKYYEKQMQDEDRAEKNKSNKRDRLLRSLQVEMGIFRESELNDLDLSTMTLFYKLFNNIKLAKNDKAMEKLRDLFFYSYGIGDGSVNYEKDESHEKIDDLLSNL
ncbi:helix-turn-helix domain-containing protein [Limosilactobacillus vaginalis]|uniref:helix-turn-helix domain-containing protein n=1 Tax=Limosilactobacillus vaginalis TaxID=1633 RepID=UPI0025A4A000|nr:helix-turn-helix transcriptional regulator [Limosilactobacillus vaginalis]MDM8220987.1 helix-turn-helix transcriptional regulator [Limosilactobacillus vaginalis]MDM8303733.1 helix-turn-helix transcriptional regulator [Limosilactobacillus vaginalis]